MKLLVAFFTLLPIAASAQTFNNGTFLGTVTDPSGATVPAAIVRVLRDDPPFRREVSTDAAGNFQVAQVPPGVYRFEFEKAGFQKAQVAQVNLSAAQQARVDMQLTVGSTNEIVKVEAAAAQVDTASANIGSTVYGTQVQELALNTRSFTQLMTLQPGVSSMQAQQPGFGSNTSVPFSFSGGQTSANNWTLDGGRNIDTFNGNNLAMVNLDAIAEVRIERNAYTSEYGRNGGAQVNVVTKAGTNTLHGSLFEFFRNDKLDARNFFANRRPKNRYNNFGGTAGGPIRKDKLFFFLSNEYRRIWQSTGTRTSIVPTDAQIAGDFSATRDIRDPLNNNQAFAGRRIPASRLDPNALALIRTFYLRPNFQQGALNFTSAEPDGTKYRAGLGRMDWIVNDKLTIFGRFNLDSTRLISPYGLFAGNPMQNVADSEQSHLVRGANVSATWVGSANLVNQLTTSFYGQSLAISTSANAARARDTNFRVPRVFSTAVAAAGLIPSISMAQGYAGIDIRWPQNIAAYTWELIDNLAWTRGRHTLKFGGSIDKENKSQNQSVPNNNGTFTFNSQPTGDSLADFLTGNAFQYTENSNHVFGKSRWENWSLYIQDQWRVSNNLTLNYGVRYELYEPEKDDEGFYSFFQPSRFDRSKAATVLPANGQIVTGTQNYDNGVVVVGRPDSPFGNAMTNTVYNTFAPRGGFSWGVGKGSRTVIRGGFGMFHDRWSQVVSGARNNWPFNQSASIFGTSFSNPAQGERRFFPIALTNFASPWNIPYYMKWSLGMQRTLPGEILADVSYVASRGLSLVRTREINQPLASADVAAGRINVNAARPYPGFAAINTNETTGQSVYHSLQVSATRRFARGLSLQTSYTFSRSIDNAVTPVYSYASSRMERALSNFDRTHVMVISYVYELPFFRNASSGAARKILGGWQASGITRFESGTPFSITVPGDRAGVGTGGQRPDVAGGIATPKTLFQWFTGTFSLPALGTFGGLGRNVVRAPGINNWDVSFSKRTRLWDRGGSDQPVELQFRAEFFNLFNHTQFSGVSAGVGAANFGALTSARDPRISQLGLRLLF